MDDDELLAFDLEGVERTAAQQKHLSDQRQPGSCAAEVQDHGPGLQQFAYSRAGGQENRPAAAPPVHDRQHSHAVHIPTAADLLKASVPRQNGVSCSHAAGTDPCHHVQQSHGQHACQPTQPQQQQQQQQAPQTLPHWPPQHQRQHNQLPAQPGMSASVGQQSGGSSATLQGQHQQHKQLQPWPPPQLQPQQPHQPPAHTQQQASQQQQQHRPSWNQQQFCQMQHNRQQQQQQQHPNPQRPPHQQHPAGMPAQVNWQQRLQQQQQERLERLGPAAQVPIIPRCPYKRCPGIFSQCGAVLRWIERRSHNFWSCSRYPHCEYKYFPAQQLPNPELGCEVVDSKHFKLAPQPAAEVAVRRAGGIRAVLAAANIQFSHLEIPQQHQQQAPAAVSAADAEGGDSCAVAPAPAHTADAEADADAEQGGSSGAGADDLGSGPMWDWSADESLLLPLPQYEVVESVLKSCRPPLLGRGGAIPHATLAAFREPEASLASEAEVSARFDAMPASLRQALMPFQREGVLYGLTRHGRVLIADEMGVGKTVQALALAACYQEEWPLLIVVPASLRLVWAEEIERWLPHIRPGDVTVIEGKDDRLNDLPDAVRRAELPAITITSYEMMKRLTCPACQKLQGAAAAAAIRAAKARQAEAAAANSTAAAASEADAGYGSTAAAAQASGGRGTGGGTRGRGRGRGRRQMAAVPVQDSVVTGSEEVVVNSTAAAASEADAGYGSTAAAAQASGGRGTGGGTRGRGRGRGRGQMAAVPVQDSVVTRSEEVVVSETGGCSDGGKAGKRCHGCSGPDHCMAALPWGVVIIDESHNLRTTRSRQGDSPQTEAAVAAAGAAPRVILLSGTPSLSRPYDLFRQVDVLQPGILGSTKEDFAHRYCDRRLVPLRNARAGPGPGGGPRLRWNNAGGARLVELHGLLVRRVMVRRLKKDVLTQLPPKRRQVIRLPHPPAHRWPKEETQAEQQQQQQGDEPQQQQHEQDGQGQEQARGAGNAAGGEMTAAGSMTAAHRLALAKLPDAIEWLMAALGSSQPESEQQQGGGRGSGKQGKSHDDGLAGPGKAPPGRLKPLWQGGSSAGCNSSGGGNSRASSGEGSVDASAGAAGQEQDEEGDEEQQEGQSGQQSGGSPGPKFLVFAHHKDVMDKLAAALAGYGSHLPDSSTAAASNHAGLDPDLAVEVAEQAARDSSNAGSGAAAAAAGSVARQGWRGVGYVRVDGSHDSAERHAAVKRFKVDPSCRVALLSITAAAVGLDFSAASMVVFVELPHEVSLVRQAEDRAHRKGQAAKAVNVYFLCAQGTVDDKHWQALNLSLAHISAVHDGEVLPQPLARAAAAAAAGAAGTDGAAAAEEIGKGVPDTSDADAAAVAGAAQAAAAPEGGSSQQPGAAGVGAALSSAAAAAAAAVAVPAESGEDAQPGVVDLTADSPVKPPISSPKQLSPHRFRPLTLTPSPNGKARRRGSRQPQPATPAPAAAAAADAGDAAAAAAASPGSTQAAPGAPELQEGCAQDGAVVPSSTPQQLAAAAAPEVLQPCSDQNFCAGGVCLTPVAPEVWFEVSKHTNRLHYHLAADGSRPLGLNIPLESLLLPEEGTLQQLAAAWKAAWQQELEKRQKQQPQQPQAQLVAAAGQAEQPSDQQLTLGGGGGGGGNQAKVASPFFARQLHHHKDQQQQHQQDEAAGEVAHHTQEAQQRDLQQQIAQTPAAPACAAAAAAATPAPGTALGFAALALGGAAPPHAIPAAPARFSLVPVSTSSRGRPIPALESLRSLMPFGHSPAAPAAAVGCASIGASARAGPVTTAVSVAAGSYATPGAAVDADVQVVSATPSPTAGAAAGAATTPHQHFEGGSSKQQQQQQDAARGTAGTQQHMLSAAPSGSQDMVQPSPGLMQRMRRLLSQSASQQQQQDEQRLAHAEHSQSPVPVTEQQEQQPCSPRQGSQQQDDDDAELGSPAGLVLNLDGSAERRPAGAVSNEVIVIPASQDTVDEQGSQQQQEQQAVQHVDLLSQSPLGKAPQQEKGAVAAEHGQQPQQQQQQQEEERQQQLVPATGTSGLPDCRSAPGFLSPSGLACLTLPLSPLALLELLRQGAAFAADWSELRSVTRNRLVGRVLPPDLASAVEAATAAAASAGAFGVGTTRYLQDIQEGDPNLPAGARLTNVSVHYPNGRQQLVTYRQAFTGGGADGSPLVRHCINCFKAVEGAVVAEDAVLQGSLDLFCSLECERSWNIKSSSGGIRRALFKLERGVCQLCNLDCHALVAQLQQIAKDSPHWLQHRRAVVAALAPKMLERGYGTLLDRLLNQATEGNAWHADHILAVYEGGGGCELDNLRTLCVACHAAVTKKQAAARAAERQRRKLGTADIRLFFGGLPAADSGGAGGAAAAKPKAGLKRKRRAQVEGSGVGGVDDLSTPEEDGDKEQPQTAAEAAAGAQGTSARAGPQGKPAAAAGPRGKTAATAAAGKKRGRPPKKQKGAGKAAAVGSKVPGQIQKWVASAAAASQGARATARQSQSAATAAAAAAAAAAAGGVTQHQPDEDAVIELLDDSQPGLDDASPRAPDSAAAALDSTPQSQRRAVKRPAAAAAEASAAGRALAGLRTVLDQFRFSQEDGSSQGQGASGLRDSGQQVSTQPSQQQQQRQQQQQGKKRKAPSKPAASKRRVVGKDRKQQGRRLDSSDGSDSEWSVGAG